MYVNRAQLEHEWLSVHHTCPKAQDSTNIYYIYNYIYIYILCNPCTYIPGKLHVIVAFCLHTQHEKLQQRSSCSVLAVDPHTKGHSHAPPQSGFGVQNDHAWCRLEAFETELHCFNLPTNRASHFLSHRHQLLHTRKPQHVGCQTTPCLNAMCTRVSGMFNADPPRKPSHWALPQIIGHFASMQVADGWSPWAKKPFPTIPNHQTVLKSPSPAHSFEASSWHLHQCAEVIHRLYLNPHSSHCVWRED